MDIFNTLPCFDSSADTAEYYCGDGAFMRIYDNCTVEYFLAYKTAFSLKYSFSSIIKSPSSQ